MNRFTFILRDRLGKETDYHVNFSGDGFCDEIRIVNEETAAEIWIPAEVIVAFIADRIRAKKISDHEEHMHSQSDLEILGVR